MPQQPLEQSVVISSSRLNSTTVEEFDPVQVVQYLLAIAAFYCTVFAIARHHNGSTEASIVLGCSGAAAFLLLLISWPLRAMARDIRAIRRLMENRKDQQGVQISGYDPTICQ